MIVNEFLVNKKFTFWWYLKSYRLEDKVSVRSLLLIAFAVIEHCVLLSVVIF